MSTAPLQQAIESTRSVLAKVTNDDLASATPCASWCVADVINHVVGGQFFFASAMSGRAPSGEAPNYAAGDFHRSFDEGAAANLAGFEADGAMERIVHLPFGDMPGSVVVGLAATDTFVHGWDLAKATGQSTDLAPDLAAQLLAGVRPALGDELRGPDGKAPFGPRQEAPEGATNADELAAFLGRTV